MSLEQSQGIQALLAAEKASAETINNARKSMWLVVCVCVCLLSGDMRG